MDFFGVLQPWPPMSLTGLSFLFVFLPLCLAACAVLPARLRPGALAACSLLYYLLAEARGVQLMAVLVLMDYCALQLMSHRDGRARKWCLWACVGVNLLALVAGMIGAQISGVRPVLGLGVCSLSGIAAALEFYRHGEGEPAAPDFLALYCLFFPRLYTGPLCGYREFAAQLEKLEVSWRSLGEGFLVLVPGVFKAGVLGTGLLNICMQIKGFTQEDISVFSTWCLVLVLALAAFYILSGLSEMARGIALMFSLTLPRNFYYPYQSRSVWDFMQRFNMTLVRFLRRDCRLGGQGDALPDKIWKVLLLCVLAGLWFGLWPIFGLWGLYLAAFLLLEQKWLKKILDALPVLLCRIYTLGIVLSSFTILAGDSVRQSLGYIRKMLGLVGKGFPVFNDAILYLLFSNWLLLVLACFFATNAMDIAVRWWRKAQPTVSLAVLCGANLMLLTAYVALTV